jgi:HEAT repeat protein
MLVVVLPLTNLALITDDPTEKLLGSLESKDKKVVENAIRQLAEKRPNEVRRNEKYKQLIAQFVANRNLPDSLREVSAFALGRAGKEAAPYAPVLRTALLNDKSRKVQRAAAEALGRVGMNGKDVLDSLNTAAQIDYIPITSACIRAIAQLQSRQTAVGYLSSVLDGPYNVEVKQTAAFTLAEFGPDGAAAVPALTRALNDAKDKDLRQVAAWAVGLIGPGAADVVPTLAERLSDPEAVIRRVSAGALQHIGSDQGFVLDKLEKRFVIETDLDAKIAMAISLAELGGGRAVGAGFFEALHSSQDRALQQAAATGLSKVVPPPNPDIDVLVGISQEEYPDVRIAAINAIGHIHQRPDKSIPALVTALSDPMPSVRLSAAEALGQFRDVGHSGARALTGLVAASRDGTTRFAAARALGGVAESLRDHFEASHDRRDFLVRGALEQARMALADLQKVEPDNYDFPDSSKSVEQALSTLNRRKWRQKIEDFYSEHSWIARGLVAIAGYLFWIALLYHVILRLSPLRLLEWNEFLERLGTINVPLLGTVVIKVRDVLLLQAHRHPRVLAAWVEAHAESARINFMSQCVKGTREVFYPLPVDYDGQLLSDLTPDAVREICSRKKWLFRIIGEGGLGKTTIACQIALWAIEHEKSKRLLPDRRLIPVMLERASGFEPLKDIPHLRTAIRGKLQDVIGEASPVPEWLCDRLLENGRLLVIIDGLSEIVPAPDQQLPLHPEYAIAALIVTSRSEHLWSGGTHVDIRPLRIDSDHLSPFMNAYLGKNNRLADTELFEACRRLAALVGNRRITPLLARMYAEQLANAHASSQMLPDNIPALVLGYVSTLNRDRKEEDPEHATIHCAAEIAAWECCKATYSAGYATKKQVARALTLCEDVKVEPLEYLEKRLQLVRTIPPADIYIEFPLDPLAEYLAGLWLLRSLKNNQDWLQFLNGLDKLDTKAESVPDFLSAVKDCFIHAATKFQGSDSILEELSNRARRNEMPAVLIEIPTETEHVLLSNNNQEHRAKVS